MDLDDYHFKFVLQSSNEEPNKYFIPWQDVNKIFSQTRWQVDQLEDLRNELNQCKSQVGQFPLIQWQRHTEFTEVSSNIKKEITKRLSVSPPILTRAWIKFYEIESCFELFDKTSIQNGIVKAMFLCEAPGAFVNAVNHYLKCNYSNVHLEWIATTLNPYYEQSIIGSTVLDDRFIKDPSLFHRWFFGDSNTGDIFEDRFTNQMEKHLSNHYNITESSDCGIFDCITADGAFDCLSSPEKQEEMVFQLILKETMVGMKFLKNNGNFVVKFFTFFSCETLSLLYLICNLFSNVTCYKPTASKHGNSEVYLICQKFDRKLYRNYCHHFENIKPENFIVNRSFISDEFIISICMLSKILSTRQMNSINFNIELFNRKGWEHHISSKKYKIASMFIKKFKVFSIPVNEHLILDQSKNSLVFSYKLLKFFNNLITEKFEDNKINLLKIINNISLEESGTLASTKTPFQYLIKPQFIHGKPYHELNNSKFCCFYILKAFILVKQHVEFEISPIQSICYRKFENFIDPTIPYFVGSPENVQYEEYIRESLTNFDIEYIHSGDSQSQFNRQKIHFFDYYNLTACITGNDFETCSQFKSEMTNLFEKNLIHLGDTVVVRFKSILSRLSVGLVYLFSKAFKHFGMFSEYTSIDSLYPSLFCVFSDFQELSSHFMPIFQSTFNHKWTADILEIVSVPLIMSDNEFYRVIFNENSTCVLRFLKQHFAFSSDSSSVLE